MDKIFYGIGFVVGVVVLALIALLPGALLHLLVAWVFQWLLSFVGVNIPLFPLFVFVWGTSMLLGFIHRSK